MTERFKGLPVIVSPDRPKLQLCDELVPGQVSWPPGFREEINAWLRSFFGTFNLLKDGEVLASPGMFYMNPRTFAALRAAMPPGDLL